MKRILVLCLFLCACGKKADVVPVEQGGELGKVTEPVSAPSVSPSKTAPLSHDIAKPKTSGMPTTVAPGMSAPSGRIPDTQRTPTRSGSMDLTSQAEKTLRPSNAGSTSSVAATNTRPATPGTLSSLPNATGEMEELEIALPQTADGSPATLPAALASPNPEVDKETQQIIDGIADGFANDLAKSGDQNYESAWNSAKAKSDDRFRAVFGQDAYNAYHIQAALEAHATSQQK